MPTTEEIFGTKPIAEQPIKKQFTTEELFGTQPVTLQPMSKSQYEGVKVKPINMQPVLTEKERKQREDDIYGNLQTLSTSLLKQPQTREDIDKYTQLRTELVRNLIALNPRQPYYETIKQLKDKNIQRGIETAFGFTSFPAAKLGVEKIVSKVLGRKAEKEASKAFAKQISPQAFQEYKPLIKPGVSEPTQIIKTVEKQPIKEVTKPIVSQNPEIDNAVKRVWGAIEELKPIRGKQQAMYTAEKAKRMEEALRQSEGLRGEEWIKARLRAMKGEYEKVEFEPLRNKIDKNDFNLLTDLLKEKLTFWEQFPAGSGLTKIMNGAVPTPGELAILERALPPEMIKSILNKRSLLSKGKEVVEEVLNMPRSFMASFDQSAPLRQGLLLLSHPKRWAQAFPAMTKSTFSEKAFNELQQSIRNRPTFNLMQESKLALTDLGTNMTNREERFLSNYAEKIPIVGSIIKGSGRGYNAYLNKLRADVFDDLIKKAEILGYQPTKTDLAKQIADFINNATGRGNLPKSLQSISGLLNGAFFSPRLMISRINFLVGKYSPLNPWFYTKLHPMVRKEALKSWGAYAGYVTSILSLASLGGAKIGLEPRSSDFGKIIIGNTRVDIHAGLQQYIRMAAQLFTGEYVSSVSGKKMSLGEGYKPLTRGEIVARQLQSKLTPAASFALTMFNGIDWRGKKPVLWKEVGNRFIPMVAADAYEIAKEDPSLLPLMIPAVYGVGVQQYSKKK